MWHHILRIGDGESWRLGNGFSASIATGAYDSNHIQIIVIGEEGALFVNGKYVATLDLSGLTDAGSVFAVATYITSDGVVGKSTQFEDFKIRLIR